MWCRKLAVKDGAGQVTLPGIDIPGYLERAFLFRSSLGANLADETVIPNTPRLSDPNVEKLLDLGLNCKAKDLLEVAMENQGH